MQSTSDRSDIELQADYESPEVVKFLNSLKDLDSPFMNEDMPRLTPVPTFKHEVST